MPTDSAETLRPAVAVAATEPPGSAKARSTIAWSSMFFALLQSICSAVVALNGVRLAIGIGSLAITVGAGTTLAKFHQDWIRIPMLMLALIGSLVNLGILWNARRLRNRPSARWRQTPLSPHKVRMERLQLVLSIATLVLVGVEEYFHHGLHHGW